MLGEILRNQHRVEDERSDRLEVGELDAGRHRFKMLELKPETTFLDGIALEVDGVAISPVDCGLHCDDDGQYTRIDAGMELELMFEVPASGHAVLVADGFYLPHRPVEQLGPQVRLEPVPDR